LLKTLPEIKTIFRKTHVPEKHMFLLEIRIFKNIPETIIFSLHSGNRKTPELFSEKHVLSENQNFSNFRK